MNLVLRHGLSLPLYNGHLRHTQPRVGKALMGYSWNAYLFGFTKEMISKDGPWKRECALSLPWSACGRTWRPVGSSVSPATGCRRNYCPWRLKGQLSPCTRRHRHNKVNTEYWLIPHVHTSKTVTVSLCDTITIEHCECPYFSWPLH